MFIQPVFYAWYVLFLFPVAVLFRTDETRILLVVCLLLYPTASAGVFLPAESENIWIFGSDMYESKLNDAIIQYSTEDDHNTTISAANGVLSYQTNSSTIHGYSTRIQWNVTNFRVDPDMILRMRMVSSVDPTYSKPFKIFVVGGFYNSTAGANDELQLSTNITFISNMTWITYYYRLYLDHPITLDNISLVVNIVENVTGTYSLHFDSFMIENDMNTLSPTWLVSIPLSLIGLVAPVLIMFPNALSGFYYALRRLRFRVVALIKGSKLHLGRDVKLCRGSRVIVERDSQVSIGDATVILAGTEIIAHSKAKINIGSNVFISRMCTISAHEGIEIGDNSSIGAFSFILDTNKTFDDAQMDIRGQGYSCKPISLGADVWLGAHVVILPGSSIGPHSVVGANSTVLSSFPENSVIAGNPAEIIRTRGERRS
jgi:acetyltransferase-like isoleucine patch superfamily enzyme